MKTKKILLADDHVILRQGLVKIIEDDGSYEVVAETGDGLQAFEEIKRLKPDIAVLDISMPTMNGLEVAKKIQKEEIDVAVIILTMYAGRKYYQEAMDCGVKGYILKENSAYDLKTALKQVSAGKYFISSHLAEHHIKSSKKEKQFLKQDIAIDDLSRAEKRVLKLISENKTSKEIADKLSVSFRTIQNHRVRICRKLGIKGMNALLQFAIEYKSKIQ